MRGGVSELTKLATAAFLGGLYFHLPIFALYFVGEGVPLSVVVSAQVFYAVASFLGEIPTGALADKFGRKKSVIIGNLFEILGLIVMVTLPSSETICAAYALRGLGGSFVSGALDAWTFEISQRAHRSFRDVAVRQKVLNLLGYTLSTAITGILVSHLGTVVYPWLFIFTALGIAGVVVCLLSIPDSSSMSSASQRPLFIGLVLPTWALLKSNSTIRSLLIVLVLSLSGEFFLMGIYQPIFVERQVPPLWLGLGMSLGALTNMVMTYGVTRLHNKLRFSSIQTACTITLGAMFIVFAVSPNPVVTVMMYVSMVGVFNSTEPLLSQYIHREIDSSIRSTVISAISFVRTGFQVLMRLVLGALVGALSPLAAAIFFGTYLIVGGIIGNRTLRSCGCTD